MRNPLRIHISLREMYLLPYILMYHKRHKKNHYSGPKSNLERENGTTTTCSTSTNIFNTCRCRIIQFLKVNGRATWESIFGARVTTNYYKFPREWPCQPFGSHLVVVKSFFFCLSSTTLWHDTSSCHGYLHLFFCNFEIQWNVLAFYLFLRNITQLLGWVLWDQVLGKHEFPLLIDFMSMGSTQAVCCEVFDKQLQMQIFLTAASFFGKSMLSTCFVILEYNYLFSLG